MYTTDLCYLKLIKILRRPTEIVQPILNKLYISENYFVWQLEIREGQSQGKFFPGWRAEADKKGSFYFPLGTPK